MEEQSQALVLKPQMDVSELKNTMQAVNKVVRDAMVEDRDFGIIPGTGKENKETGEIEGRRTLLQPGAEKLDKFFGLVPEFTLLSEQVDLTTGFIRKRYECRLIHFASGKFAGSAIRVCHNFESKYAYTWVDERYATAEQKANVLGRREYKNKGYTNVSLKVRKSPLELLDLENTMEGMAQKRAHVAATRQATGATDIFADDRDEPTDEAPDVDDEGHIESTPYRKTLIKDLQVAAKARGFSDKLLHASIQKVFGNEFDSIRKLDDEQLKNFTETILSDFQPVKSGEKPKRYPDKQAPTEAVATVVEGEVVEDKDPQTKEAEEIFEADSEPVAKSDPPVEGSKGGAAIPLSKEEAFMQKLAARREELKAKKEASNE